ncbi:hypothetical protein GCM10023238_34610 [Streptomyces heliomycini]
MVEGAVGMGRWRDGRGELIVRGEDGERPPVRVALEIAASYRARTKGLLGRDSLDGALLLSPRQQRAHLPYAHAHRRRLP